MADAKVPETLDAYFRAVEEKDPAARRRAGPSPADVLAYVDAADGLCRLDELTGAGFSEPLLLELLATPAGADRRSRPRLRGAVLAGERWVWPTTAGWSAAGRPNRREAAPSARTIGHRQAPRRMASWVEEHLAPAAAANDILVDPLVGADIRTWVTACISTAWSAVRVGGGAAEEAGKLLGGVYPDLLVVESWPRDRIELGQREQHCYPGVRGAGETSEPDWRVAVEIELAEKPDLMLAHKVAQHERARALGWWHAVLWVVDDRKVAERLQRALLAAGAGRAPAAHYTADPADVGVGPYAGAVPTTWRLVDLAPRSDSGVMVRD